MSLPRYEQYKDSGVEWIGEIPEGWAVKRLKYIIGTLESGVSVNATDCPATDDGYGILKTSCVYDYRFNADENKAIWESEIERAKVNPRKGAIIISRMNTPDLVGASGHVDRDYPNLFLPDRLWQTVFNDEVEVESKWLSYIFKSEHFRKLIAITATGTSPSMKNLGQEEFTDISIPFTSLVEQAAIASFLDRKTAEIDQFIANKEKLIALYEEEKTAIINRAVTRGLDSLVTLKPSGINWLGDIPEHWEVKRLKYVTHEIITGKTPSSGNDAYFNGDINWFTPGDFDDSFILRESKRTISESAVTDSGIKLFPAQTVLLVSIGATLGKIGITEGRGASNQQINAIVFDKSQVFPFWGLYYLNSVKDAIYRLANSATLPIFNQSQTKDFEILVPTLPEQLTITTHIETECTRLDAIIDKFKKQIELFKEYRTTLISEVVTGKIDVREGEA